MWLRELSSTVRSGHIRTTNRHVETRALGGLGDLGLIDVADPIAQAIVDTAIGGFFAHRANHLRYLTR